MRADDATSRTRPRRRRRPWHRTRAFRLTRTAVLAVVLVTAGVRCGGDDRPSVPQRAEAAGAPGRADARGDPLPGETDDDGARPTRAGSASPARGAAASRSPAGTASPSPAPSASRSKAGPSTGATASGTAAGGKGRADAKAAGKPPATPLPPSRPTTFGVPALGIKAPVIGLRLDDHRQLSTPPVDRPKLVGWYQAGPTPGAPGTAIAVGHRDTTTGPAVFAALAEVKPGNHIEVGRADGRTAVYTVDRVRVFDKSGFPDKEVYGPSKRAELRVITCGGLFTRRTGYTSNVVVFAHLTAVK
ncbi:class F sortase [Streptomyces galbus]|uniref:Class F sortase n=1 Tax=Streptomyces galbus TaxID=33898 RepID=A0A4V6AXG3_STRGB|nr:class F sortase [Streptomyces galbus]